MRSRPAHPARTALPHRLKAVATALVAGRAAGSARRARPGGRARLIAVVTGLLTATLTITPYATAQDAEHPRATPAQLASAAAAVQRADVAGTAWYSDIAAGRLVVAADSRVHAKDIARIKDAVRERDTPVDIRRTPGRFTERIAGGDLIQGPNGTWCKVAFNVRDGSGVKYALTAGHCTVQGSNWSIGQVVGSSFPGNDYGLIRYTDQSQAEPGVRGPSGTLILITNARTPSVGERVCVVGRTTGMHCGSVFSLNATVNYGGGDIVYGLIGTNVCSEPGDSGGPLFTGNSALGIASGGSGNCSSGGQTFFQPVVEAMNAYGVTIL